MKRIVIGLTLSGLALASLLSVGAQAQRTSLAQNPDAQAATDTQHPNHRPRPRPHPHPPVPHPNQALRDLQGS